MIRLSCAATRSSASCLWLREGTWHELEMDGARWWCAERRHDHRRARDATGVDAGAGASDTYATAHADTGGIACPDAGAGGRRLRRRCDLQGLPPGPARHVRVDQDGPA